VRFFISHELTDQSSTNEETVNSISISAGEAYRFTRFRTALLIDDLTFGRREPGPGDRLPSFDLPTLDGGRFISSDPGSQPVLMVFGSRTCPVTESAGPVLATLHRQFGDRVRFVLVNTREAHPGERFDQPRTAEEKWRHAQELREHHAVAFEVAVDDLDGTLHRAMTGPLLRAVGHLPGVVRFAGARVGREIWLAAAPLAVLGRVSRLFGRLPADRRGAAAAILVGVPAAAALFGAVR
jgi:hypothetical protein